MSGDGAKRNQKGQRVSKSLDQGLTAYALVAGAAGVAVVACSMPAEAAPVCHTLSVTLAHTATYSFNPDHQAIPPFDVAQTYNEISSHTNSQRNRLFFTPNSRGANVVLASNGFPADLQSGANIGPGDSFGKGNSYGLLFNYGPGTGATRSHHKGNLQFGATNYVGFEFLISGQTHYGWVRLQANLSNRHPRTQILQYGFESSANTAILAGSCTSAPSAEVTPPSASDSSATAKIASTEAPVGSLGALALGADGIALWRRK